MNAEREIKLNPRQRKLVLLLLDVEQGKMNLKDALKQAGYADSTAEQQSATLNRVRTNSAMQEALRKAGFTEDVIAEKIVHGVAAADLDIQHKFLKTGAELLDAFPAKKQINADVGLDELIKQQEASAQNANLGQ